MIKGVDAQIMTQRVTEYSKDVTAMLRRDQLANEFADRMNKLNAQQEARTVSQLEKAERARINADQEREPEQRRQQDKDEAGRESAAAKADMAELPGIGQDAGTHLLDIEI